MNVRPLHVCQIEKPCLKLALVGNRFFDAIDFIERFKAETSISLFGVVVGSEDKLFLIDCGLLRVDHLLCIVQGFFYSDSSRLVAAHLKLVIGI